MADVALTVAQGDRDGVVLPAEVDGHATNVFTADNTDGKVGILVRNSDASSRDVTFQTGASVDGLAVADRTVSVPAGETHLFSDFSVGQYGNPLRITAVQTTTKLRAIKL